jgi:hypothetical protein
MPRFCLLSSAVASLMSELLDTLIAPLSRVLYEREPFASSLDHHHSFVVHYSACGGAQAQLTAPLACASTPSRCAPGASPSTMFL